jgi:hypothetical protein
MLAELGLVGRFYEIPEYLFFNRDHKDRSARACLTLYGYVGFFDPAKKGHIVLQCWMTYLQYLKSVNHFSLSLNERLYCYKHLAKWMLIYYKEITIDPIITLKYLIEFYLLKRC